jgi:hypothetical protein
MPLVIAMRVYLLVIGPTATSILTLAEWLRVYLGLSSAADELRGTGSGRRLGPPMSADDKIYVDAHQPATLNDGAGKLTDYPTLQETVMGMASAAA